MTASVLCHALIKHFEGCRLTAYADSVGMWTIGYGSTFFENGRAVKKGDTITAGRAEILREITVSGFAEKVAKLLRRELKHHEFDALVSFAFNCGIGNLQSSTLLKKVNANAPVTEIIAEFMRWNKAGGKVLAGLTRRRAAEAYLYKHGKNNFKTV